MRYSLVILLLTVVLMAPSHALGGGHDSTGRVITLPNPLGSTTTFTQLLDKILTFLLTIGAPLASIMVIWGAFQILFAGGDPEKFLVGRRTILYTAIAYGILLMAKGVTLIIKDFLTRT